MSFKKKCWLDDKRWKCSSCNTTITVKNSNLVPIQNHIIKEHYINGSTLYIEKHNAKEDPNYIAISDGNWLGLRGIKNNPRKDDNDLCAKSKTITKPVVMTTIITANKGTEKENNTMRCNLCGRKIGDFKTPNTRVNELHSSLIKAHITKCHPKPMLYDIPNESRYLFIKGITTQ